jgi:hypothetical protein
VLHTLNLCKEEIFVERIFLEKSGGPAYCRIGHPRSVYAKFCKISSATDVSQVRKTTCMKEDTDSIIKLPPACEHDHWVSGISFEF